MTARVAGRTHTVEVRVVSQIKGHALPVCAMTEQAVGVTHTSTVRAVAVRYGDVVITATVGITMTAAHVGRQTWELN